MLDIMYRLPSLALSGVTGCVVTKDVVEKREEPILVYNNEAQAASG
jgi:ATP-dependent protease Clp ATPase subunit